MSLSDAVRVELRVASEHEIAVVACRVEERLSAPLAAEVTVRAALDADLGDLVGRDATLVLRVAEEERVISLIVGAVRPLGRVDGWSRLRIELFSRFWLLGHRTDTRKLRGLDTEQIVARVLDAHGVAHRFHLARPTPRRKYLVQYDETDRRFVERILAFQGIHYVAEDDGALIMTDRTSALPPIEGGPVPLRTAGGALRHAERAVTALRARARVTPGKVTVADVDWKRPALDLARSHAAPRFAELEHYEYGAGYRDGPEGEHLARIRLEALRAEASVLEGVASVLSLKAGRALALDDPPAPVGAEHLLVSVEHRFSFAAGAAYEARFRAVPRAVPHRPAVVPRPVLRGHHTATVRGPSGSEIHTDVHGRFRAQLHWDREAVGTDADSRWMRLAQASSTSLFLARVGWEVFVEHLDGDPDRPVGVARAINGKMPPVYGQPANRTVMSIKTPSSPGGGGYNEWRMNDAAGAMAIDLRAERDLGSHAEHDQIESIGRDEVRVCQNNLSRAVDHDQAVSIGRDDERQVGAGEAIAVGGGFTRVVGGAEHVSAGGALTENVQGDDHEIVASVRLTLAGGVHVPNPVDALAGVTQISKGASIALGAAPGLATALGAGTATLKAPAAPSPEALAAAVTPSAPELVGSISRSARDLAVRLVGGAEIAVVGGQIQRSSGGELDQAVGGARFVSARAGDIAHDARSLHLTVGGALVRKAGEDASHAAARTELRTGGGAAFAAGAEVTIRAATVVLEATSRLALGAGVSAGIELTPAGVALRGDLGFDADEGIRVRALEDMAG